MLPGPSTTDATMIAGPMERRKPNFRVRGDAFIRVPLQVLSLLLGTHTVWCVEFGWDFAYGVVVVLIDAAYEVSGERRPDV